MQNIPESDNFPQALAPFSGGGKWGHALVVGWLLAVKSKGKGWGYILVHWVGESWVFFWHVLVLMVVCSLSCLPPWNETLWTEGHSRREQSSTCMPHVSIGWPGGGPGKCVAKRNHWFSLSIRLRGSFSVFQKKRLKYTSNLTITPRLRSSPFSIAVTFQCCWSSQTEPFVTGKLTGPSWQIRTWL